MSKESRKKRQQRGYVDFEQRRARQNRTISLVAALLMLLVVVAFVWAYARDDAAPATAVAGSGVTLNYEGCAAFQPVERSLAELTPAARNGFFATAPEMIVDADRGYEALISVADRGSMRVQLFTSAAPLTVNNFVTLAASGFYDGVPFHRVLDGFMAQTGDPTGTGTGGPGYAFADETSNGLLFDRSGLLAMANSGPNTNGSQFFITYVPTDWLDGAHTIFGELVEGQDVLDSLVRVDPTLPNQPAPDVIERIDILECS